MYLHCRIDQIHLGKDYSVLQHLYLTVPEEALCQLSLGHQEIQIMMSSMKHDIKYNQKLTRTRIPSQIIILYQKGLL